jgi:small-conductance mechanosensitive channel
MLDETLIDETLIDISFGQTVTLEDLLISLLITFIGFIIGIIIERWILPRMYGSKTSAVWRSDRVLITALRGMVIAWSTLGAAYIAILQANFSVTTTQSLLRLLQVPFIFSISVFAMRLSAGFIDYYNQKRGRGDTSASLWRSLASVAIFLIGTLILLQSLGISITPIITALGIGGLAASLALQDTLSNVFSGLYIIFSKQTKPGDYVRLKVDERDHVEGYITDITWRSTKIRQMPIRMIIDPEPSEVIVPNSRMASDIVVMHHRRSTETELRVDIAVAYGIDLEHVEQVTLEEARLALRDSLPGNAPAEPLLRYRDFAPGSINLSVLIYGGELFDQYRVRHELLKRLYRRYEREGITLAFADSDMPAAASFSAAFMQQNQQSQQGQHGQQEEE